MGAEVELIGSDLAGANGLPALARTANTITHELLCRVCPSIERVYISGAGAEPGGELPPEPFQAVTREPKALVA